MFLLILCHEFGIDRTIFRFTRDHFWAAATKIRLFSQIFIIKLSKTLVAINECRRHCHRGSATARPFVGAKE